LFQVLNLPLGDWETIVTGSFLPRYLDGRVYSALVGYGPTYPFRSFKRGLYRRGLALFRDWNRLGFAYYWETQ